LFASCVHSVAAPVAVPAQTGDVIVADATANATTKWLALVEQ
jgi:hypothetical protein